MNTRFLLVLLTLIMVGICADVGQQDIIDAVPGYDDNTVRVFSKYLFTKANLQLHYILVQSKAGPDNNDPLLLWIGDGPGCSSKLGFLSEIGPYYLPAASNYDGNVNLQKNLYSWHNLSNLLFIDSPAGVGHSVAQDDTYLYNDQNTAQDTLQALIYFFKSKFTSYQSKSFYLAGQSYAGKYIPDLALRINAYNLNGQFKINLIGILVGNGIMDFSDSSLQKSQIGYMFSRNFVDPTLDKYWDQSCQTDPASAGCQFFFRRYDEILSKVNYHSIYGTCYQQVPPKIIRSNSLNSYQNKKVQFYNTFKKCQKHGGVQNYFRTNIDSFHASNQQFVLCNETIYNIYDKTQSGSMNQYSRLITQTSIRIHLYAGDWDDIVPYTNTIRNIQRLGLRQSGDIRHWINIKNQHIGFKRLYIQGQRQIKFWIVKGAGHQVARHKREVAFQLLNAFLKNSD